MNLSENYINKIKSIRQEIKTLKEKEKISINELLKSEDGKTALLKLFSNNIHTALYFLDDSKNTNIASYGSNANEIYINLRTITKTYFNDPFLGYMLNDLCVYEPWKLLEGQYITIQNIVINLITSSIENEENERYEIFYIDETYDVYYNIRSYVLNNLKVILNNYFENAIIIDMENFLDQDFLMPPKDSLEICKKFNIETFEEKNLKKINFKKFYNYIKDYYEKKI